MLQKEVFGAKIVIILFLSLISIFWCENYFDNLFFPENCFYFGYENSYFHDFWRENYYLFYLKKGNIFGVKIVIILMSYYFTKKINLGMKSVNFTIFGAKVVTYFIQKKKIFFGIKILIITILARKLLLILTQKINVLARKLLLSEFLNFQS